MHLLMVKPLPRRCRLTALFDVSQVNCMAYDTLTKCLQCCSGSGTLLGPSFSDACVLLAYFI